MDQVNFFKCLSDETRLNIVTLVTENKELCVCDLTYFALLVFYKIDVKDNGSITVSIPIYLLGV